MKKIQNSSARWDNSHRALRINPKRKGKENWRKAYLIGQKTQSFRKRGGGRRKNPLSERRSWHYANDSSHEPFLQGYCTAEKGVGITHAKSLRFSGQKASHSDWKRPLASLSSISRNPIYPQMTVSYLVRSHKINPLWPWESLPWRVSSSIPPQEGYPFFLWNSITYEF